jgi:hypothetical protein
MTDLGTQRHTGTVRRGALRRPQPPSSPRPMDGRAGWIALVAALVLAAGVVGWLLGGGAGDASGDATDAVSGASATASATLSPTDEPTTGPTPTATAAITSEPTPAPTPSPTLTPDPTSRPSPQPTAPPAGLVIDFPVDGGVVRSSRINVIGTAPPGATVTRHVPFWFDDHTTAGDDGLWMMPVELAEGENRLTFRIGDDTDTAQVLLVTYRPTP